MNTRIDPVEHPLDPSSPTAALRADQVERAHELAVAHLATIQSERGAWGGEVWWNNMLACQYVFMCKILDRPISAERRRAVYRTLEVQEQPGGGWGMHAETGAWMFHTTLGYIALRLTGHSTKDPMVARAGVWIHENGGIETNPTWGRIWLAMLGLHPWRSIRGILPELWLLPDTAPLHPSRLYCHMRLIYLGLSCVGGLEIVAPSDATLHAISKELLGEKGRAKGRGDAPINEQDLFDPPGRLLDAALTGTRWLGNKIPAALRRRALDRALAHIRFEFESTNYVCLSPVNGMLFTLVLARMRAGDPGIEKAIAGLEYWVWEDEAEGLRIAGARSDIWDTSFILQALALGDASRQTRTISQRACAWLQSAQMLEDVVGGRQHYRAPAQGGWGFADEHHPWPVSDCTAEAIGALMACAHSGLDSAPIDLDRLRMAAEFILRRQNPDGGFGSYEARRGPTWLRRFNPAEIYGNCMIEYSYVECTASCIRGLAEYLDYAGQRLEQTWTSKLREAIQSGVRLLLREQESSGAWAGFWGINRSYGTFFATAALRACAFGPDHEAMRNAARWLMDHQRADGGWLEGWQSLLDGRDVGFPADARSSATQTAWAVCALIDAAPTLARPHIERGLRFLVAQQCSDGTWPEEAATGVFFNTAVLDYRLYGHQFPLMALAKFRALTR